MVRNYKRKSKKASYDKNQLREAVLAVQNGVLSGYKASQVYNIPRMTIMDHVHKKRSSHNIGRKTTLSTDVEKNLALCLHTMEKYGFGLTRVEVLEMVGAYIDKNNISACFKNGRPGKDWFVSFSKRHNLSIKKPQAVEYARKTAIDPYIVYPYFDLLEETVIKLGLKDKPYAIWNLDETSFSKDPSKTKIVGVKGYAATRVIATPGKDNTTVLLGANAAGQKMPPLIIFKGKNVWDEWTDPDAYPGTTYAATKNGWMESEVFENFFKKTFLPTIGNQRPILLIYDGHSTHVGLNIIEEARKAEVTILKIPSHTSHILQPLDVAVIKSFKDKWDVELVKWQRMNIGLPLPKKEFSKLIGSIWKQINSEVLRNGFKKSGIYPMNRNVIDLRIFDPLQLKHWQQKTLSLPKTPHKEQPKTLLLIALNCLNKRNYDAIPINKDNSNKNNLEQILTEGGIISFEELLLQKVKRGDSYLKTKRRKVAQGAAVITHDDVVKFKKDEQNKRNNKKAKTQPNSSGKLTNEVILLKDISKNNSQLVPFSVKNFKNLPRCLQENVPDTHKIKILSNIRIKDPIMRDGDHFSEPGPSGIKTISNIKSKIINSNATSFKISKSLPIVTRSKEKGKGKKSVGKENKIPDLNKTDHFNSCKYSKSKLMKQNNHDISLSSSTTSVSGTCSNHSDSDILNVSSDEPYYDEYSDLFLQNIIPDLQDEVQFEHSESKHKEEIDIKKETEIKHETEMKVKTEEKHNMVRFNLRNKCKNNDHEVNFKTTNQLYSINDHVLVRYFNKNKWTYYVGIVESNRITDEGFYYSIRFYKTIKKPKLMFKMTKKIDRDDVPNLSIVKKIDLSNDTQILNSFVLSCEDDEVYFY